MSEGAGVEPEIVRRAPGRINLIGEHTDYAMLPVLPMAIDREVRVTGNRAAGPVHIVSRQFRAPLTLGRGESLDEMDGWHRYAWAAHRLVKPDAGGQLQVDATLPTQGGLSSSSALTVALIAALFDLDGRTPTAEELVEVAVAAERLAGVVGGAMDQNVIVRAQQGHALRIDFAPFATRNVPLPDDMAFVAAYSGTVAAKGAGARGLYHRGVVGARLAALTVGRALGVDVVPPYGLDQVADLVGLDSAVEVLSDHVSLAAHLKSHPDDLGVAEGVDLASTEPLAVRSYARHILGEARRVDDAEAAIRSGDLAILGALFSASHASLRRFGASTDPLDRLVAAMLAAGASGARLTGAGFGGFAIAVCAPDVVGSVIDAAVGSNGGPAFRVKPGKGVT